MCGIVGIFHQDQRPVERSRLQAMCASLRHRGPDDEGIHVSGGLGLGMRRLSIIDLAGGRQPLYNEDNSLVLVFNGEVYNYRELREPLMARGHRFRSQSDGEVILHLYEEKGLAALDDLNGMYAFCLWDERRKEGYLVRDRLGVKPLYYSVADGQLRFASEIKALLADGLRPAADPEALSRYLAFMYIPGELSPWEGVRRLPAAHRLRFGPGGVEPPRRYWSVPVPQHAASSEGDLREEFHALMESSIEFQSRSDVPVGVFLSGGLDSSLITALFSRRARSRVLSFNVKYVGAGADESLYARKVADLFGCEHKSVELGLEAFLEDLPRLIWHMDEPSADHALVAAYRVSALAARDIKVILNGSGGDELFGGYPRYMENPWPLRAWHRLPRAVQGAAAAALEKLFPRWDSARKARYNATADDTYLWRLMQFKPYHLESFDRDRPRPYVRDGLLDRLLSEAPRGDVNRYLYLDTRFYLVDDLLLLLDKMTMAASIEGRVPFLDHRLVEWAFKLKGSLKVRRGETKHIVKQWLRGVLPDEILFRSKMGFGAPIRDWMERGLFARCHGLVDSRPEGRSRLYWGLRGRDLERKMRSLNFQQNYALLVLELWFRIFVDGAPPEDLSRELKK